MASRKVEDVHGNTRECDSMSGLPRSGSIAEELQAENSLVKSQKSGKLRTALTFFGVRKSICLLPSFFGGRNKSQNKKGVCKSRTHDGLSKSSHEDSGRSGYTTAVDFEYHNHKDPAGNCDCDCSPPTADHKSFSLPRQRRGLKSLFQSFKHHRNNKNVDKTEMVVMSIPHCRPEEPVVQDNSEQFVSECLGSEPDVPDSSDDCDISPDPECICDDIATSEQSVESEKLSSAHGEQLCDNQVEENNLTTSVLVAYKESSRGHSEPCLKLESVPDSALKLATPASSSDQLNLIYGEVASLKSFDSLTGCGDIIADQEDDSITESSVSGERSRNGGKRASCYLTYQGGGEEMASPEDLDESCLQDFWGNEPSEQICCGFNQDQSDLTCTHNTEPVSSVSAQQASGVDTSTMDALTPQSEHQESVPNSDEGYYDSTTPGPEEGQDKLDRLQKERLPRDSYSGDALYELFAPDESLISPHFDKQPSFKPSEFVRQSAETDDSVFVPEMEREQICAGMFEALEPSSKSSEFSKGRVGLQEGVNKGLNSTPGNVKQNVFDVSTVADCEKRLSNISFRSTSDADVDTFREAKEQHLAENKPLVSPYRSVSDDNEGQAVSFSQALVDYTKNSHMMSDLHMDGFQTASAFSANMQALPSIVTFDVVDMHNEGEYDEHMELGEDIASPFQELEESYLQKDAFAECDYQMMDLYEQSLIGNTWTVPAGAGHFAKLNHSSSLSQNCRGSPVEAELTGVFRDNSPAVSQAQSQMESGSDSSSYYQKNVSSSELRASGAVAALSWEKRTDGAPSLLVVDGEVIGNSQSFKPTIHKMFPSP
ncbi:APC membrane recruitment protein 1-like [Neosynchiropus ocellatus]